MSYTGKYGEGIDELGNYIDSLDLVYLPKGRKQSGKTNKSKAARAKSKRARQARKKNRK